MTLLLSLSRRRIACTETQINLHSSDVGLFVVMIITGHSALDFLRDSTSFYSDCGESSKKSSFYSNILYKH